MAEIVNLRRKRKAARRLEEQREATANRVRFGQPKAEREKAKAEVARADKDLAGKKLD